MRCPSSTVPACGTDLANLLDSVSEVFCTLARRFPYVTLPTLSCCWGKRGAGAAAPATAWRGRGRREDPRAGARGRLADGGTFHGRLTLQALTLDAAGHLVASGVLAGTATPSSGRVTKIPTRPFTTPAALLDLWGTCTPLILALAPLTVARLAHPLTLMPILLAPQAAPQEERLFQGALCTVARLQK